MFAAAKIARVMSSKVLIKVLVFWEWKRGKQSSKKFSKKSIKTIVRLKKGFYICTRLTRKRVKKEDKKVHRHIELTA